MNTTRKVLLSVLVVGAIGSVVALGAFSAFSSTTSNDNNTFKAGTVVIGNNGGSNALYTVPNAKPGAVNDACIKVTYSGTLDADVKLYTPSTIPAIGQYVNLTIQKGTQSPAPATWNDCTGFVADTVGGTPYSGTLSNFASTRNGWANGLVTNPGSATKWAANDAVVYKFSTSVADNNLAQGATIGAHTFTWEAQNK